jgi:hypothetical protein
MVCAPSKVLQRIYVVHPLNCGLFVIPTDTSCGYYTNCGYLISKKMDFIIGSDQLDEISSALSHSIDPISIVVF